MLYLNLDKDFEPFGKGIEYEVFDFPSGCEPHIKIKPNLSSIDVDYLSNIEDGFSVKITTRFKTAGDIQTLLLATDALRRMGVNKISLFIPYLPFARQDRVMVPGEPLSIKVLADQLNSQKYSRVELYDPHSEVSLAVIDNSVAYTNYPLVDSILKDFSDFLIISPDAGSLKKIYKVAQYVNYQNDIILCNKVRDVATGKIKKLTVDADDLKGKDCFIIDDIVDGGGTFIGIAQELKKKNCGKIYLIVSHGIFSNGEEVLKQHLDGIFTTNSVKDIKSDFIEQYKMNLV